jgi:hypothetical protein
LFNAEFVDIQKVEVIQGCNIAGGIKGSNSEVSDLVIIGIVEKLFNIPELVIECHQLIITGSHYIPAI